MTTKIKNKKRKRNIITEVVKKNEANKEFIKEKAKIRYQNLSEEQKGLKRQYSRDRHR